MIATNQTDISANLKKYFDLAFSGEPIIVSRKRNAEYLAMLDKSIEHYQKGETISFSIEEWKAMENDN